MVHDVQQIFSSNNSPIGWDKKIYLGKENILLFFPNIKQEKSGKINEHYINEKGFVDSLTITAL